MGQYRRSYLQGPIEEIRNLLAENVKSAPYKQWERDQDLLEEINSWLERENEAKVDEQKGS